MNLPLESSKLFAICDALASHDRDRAIALLLRGADRCEVAIRTAQLAGWLYTTYPRGTATELVAVLIEDPWDAIAA